jgi:hypothetical protein
VALLVLENVNGLTFLAGAGWCYLGLAAVSRPLANVAAGAVLMGLGVVPYWWRKRKR